MQAKKVALGALRYFVVSFVLSGLSQPLRR